jgi:hypothetical protein
LEVLIFESKALILMESTESENMGEEVITEADENFHL